MITEDNYIDYLTRTDVSTLMPVTLGAKLRHSHFLFLGYSMRDWNLRVMPHRIWAEQSRSYKSWAISSTRTRSTRSSGTGAGSTSSTPPWRSTSPG